MLISKKKLKIAFQGMAGAYSNMACEECFPNAKAIPCISFENMLETTKSKVSDLAMVPIENSVAGRVADIHNLIPESGLHIIGDCLLYKSPSPRDAYGSRLPSSA